MDKETIDKIIEMQTTTTMMTTYLSLNGYIEGYFTWANDVGSGCASVSEKIKKRVEAN